MTKLRAGLIGLGMMGKNHARVLHSLDGVELVAVADPGGDVHGISQNAKLYQNVSELINQINSRIGNFQATNPKIKVFNEAVGCKTGNITFYQSGGGKTVNGAVVEYYYGAASIRKPKLVTEAWEEMTFSETTCKSITFDDYIKREGLNGEVIDFIWADIQGAEVDLILNNLAAVLCRKNERKQRQRLGFQIVVPE
jgi:FkbM family methyltransferase